MRILLVTNGLRYGGAERIVQALAEDLKSRNHAVEVVATTRGGPIATELTRKLIPVHVLGIRSPFDLRIPALLAQKAGRMGAELIHSHLAVSDIACALAKPLLPKTKLLTMVHNPGVELAWAKKRLWQTSLRAMDKVWAVSEAARANLPQNLSVDILEPSLINEEAPLPSRDEARKQLGLRLEQPVIMGIGRLSPIKGYDVLKEALNYLKHPQAQIVLIGEGPEKENLQHPRLKLLGSISEAAELLPAADILVQPSRSEGFPQVPLHAMAAKVPVVATRVGGTPEVVLQGETGLLVEKESPEQLAEALDQLLSAPSKARALGEAGYRRLLDSGFTRQKMVHRALAGYQSLLVGR